MFKQAKIDNLDDFFRTLGQRRGQEVFFYRVNGTNQQIHDFILRYYEAAGKNGVIIEGRIPNPENHQLAYYGEIMGMDFQMSPAFIDARLKKWLPRMNDRQRGQVTSSVFGTLDGLRKAGKNDNMLRNTYIKFMCWLYYKFERIVNQLGQENLPKILYEGTVSQYELLLMNVLCTAGCDILLIQTKGDAPYRTADPEGTYSEELILPDMVPFPADFSLKQFREELAQARNRDRLYGEKPRYSNCTNTWMKDDVLTCIRQDGARRENGCDCFCNLFCRLKGVWDRTTCQNDLYLLLTELRSKGKKVVIVNGRIEPPGPEEIQSVHRKNYQNAAQLIADLSGNLRMPSNPELQKIARRAFVDILLDEEKKEKGNINRLTGKAVYLLCWMKRYESQLFGGGVWDPAVTAGFFYMGPCRQENDALFLRFLARMPVDVIVFNPDPQKTCSLKDPLLKEVTYEESLDLREYPQEGSQLRVGTVAYHAERELDMLLYQDSGFYRNQQYAKAQALSLQTMYEEIPVLWEQELKYRPNFGTVGDIVHMPVIFSKVSGVKDGDVSAYWSSIRRLMTEDTIVISTIPQLSAAMPNPMRAGAASFWRNGRLQKAKIKEYRDYPYGFLRESVQDHLLDKIQSLIEQKTIRGTFENGAEYAIIATALNLNKEILRLVQKFDFTKKNPKMIYIITGERALSLEDTIQAAFLNQVGFDILFFVPTGYQCVEHFFNGNLLEEHQIGEYLYDLEVPDLNRIQPAAARHSWVDRIFKRG